MTNFVLSDASGQKTPVNKQGFNDVIQRKIMCAVHGLPFVATFKRNAAGIYVWQRSEPHMGAGSARNSSEVFADDVPMSKMLWSGFECAWCGVKDHPSVIIHCCSCDELVCTGRTDGTRHFTCYDECGKSGLITDTIKEVTMSDGVAGNLDGTGRRQIGYTPGGMVK